MPKIPKMTKIHYSFLADIIKDLNLSQTQKIEFGGKLRATNPKFSFEKFIKRALGK